MTSEVTRESVKTSAITSQNGIAVRITDRTKPVMYSRRLPWPAS